MSDKNMSAEFGPIIIEGKPGPAQSIEARRTYEKATSLKQSQEPAQDPEAYARLLSANGVPQADVERQVSIFRELRGMISSAIGQTKATFSQEQPQPQPIEIKDNR